VKRWVGILLLASARVGAAQANPEDVVRAFFKAEEEERWQDAAALLDQSYVVGMQRNIVHGFRNRSSIHKLTVEELMRADSTMPRAVAEYQLKRMNDVTRDSDFLENDFARITTVDSLALLTPSEAAARWLEAKGPVYRTERSYRRGWTQVDCPDMSDSAKRAMLVKKSQFSHSTILGAARNSDSVSYVIVGITYDAPRFENSEVRMEQSPRTMTLHKVSGAWKIVPTLDMPDAYGLGGMNTFAIACGRGELLPPPASKN